MDSVSQLVLGSALSIAVMGRKTAVWKGALVGAVCGTLPDLDVLVHYGDAIRDMTYHRSWSHSLFYLSLLATPFITWIVTKVFDQRVLWRSWALAIWLALITHPLLDVMTIYGTQLGVPFTDHPFAVGSIFIIDPAYTLWLLLGVGLALYLRGKWGVVANATGLALSTAYLCWSFIAQQFVLDNARQNIALEYGQVNSIIATPTPLNTLIWRIVAIQPDGYLEGYYSLLGHDQSIDFSFYSNDKNLYQAVHNNWYIKRMAWFTQGIFSVAENNGDVIITDLRMGGEPCYIFRFDLGPIEQVMRTDDIQVSLLGQNFDRQSMLFWFFTSDKLQPIWQCQLTSYD